MKISSLLEIIGSGSMLLLAGVVTFLLGIGFGLSDLSQLPLWVCLCALGALAGIIGFALIDHGSEEAEKQVSSTIAAEVVHQKPWVIAGASVLGGLVLAHLTRSRQKIVVAEVVSSRAPAPARDDAPPPADGKSGFDVPGFVREQVHALGAMAASTAVALAWQKVGVPYIRHMVDQMFGTEEDEFVPETGTAKATAARTASVPSHNGASRVG